LIKPTRSSAPPISSPPSITVSVLPFGWEEEPLHHWQASGRSRQADTVFKSVRGRESRPSQVFRSRPSWTYRTSAEATGIGCGFAMIRSSTNDDANRALMGSNMQRQSVPLLRPKRRWWHRHGKSHGHRFWGRVIAKRDGWSTRSNSRNHHPGRARDRRRTTSREINADIYQLTKFKRSNQNTAQSASHLLRLFERDLRPTDDRLFHSSSFTRPPSDLWCFSNAVTLVTDRVGG